MPSASDELEVQLNELHRKFERLKVLYEQYFMGIEKVEPATPRKELGRAILDLQQMQVRNTGLRFKAATLVQKWNIYQSYWNRTLRDIEAGRYARHVATARRRAAQEGVEFPAEAMGLHLPAMGPHRASAGPGEQRGGVDPPPERRPPRAALAGDAVPPTSGPAAEPPAAAVQTPPLGGPSVPTLTEEQLRELHRRVVEAQQAIGEKVTRYEVLAAQLQRQLPQLLAEHRCTSITFDVVTKDGRVRLKPRPLR
ncbi:MAG: MXAN_5187 C-terminal domain-containing protein [Myxococcales bacterium]|nr:hypothetical protein [Myxococcota bacterium]MDW8281359.1 MXAN_5187 C-terminal domain-containing protein [Myxococcales bacterium]